MPDRRDDPCRPAEDGRMSGRGGLACGKYGCEDCEHAPIIPLRAHDRNRKKARAIIAGDALCVA
jgi:hypothetical protein